jgi:hypothetical protein
VERAVERGEAGKRFIHLSLALSIKERGPEDSVF